MSLNSTSPSSISRHQPIIFTIIGLTIGCAIYCAVTYNSGLSTTLQRRNAIHGRRQQQRQRPQPRYGIQDGPDESSQAQHPVSSHDDSNDAVASISPEMPSRITTTSEGRGADLATVAETETDSGHPSQNRDGVHLKELLYYMAEDQSRQNAYVHKGVTCDSCFIKPIRGIRWRCLNCVDYDLCSECEASGVHHKTHVFCKIKIPMPRLGPYLRDCIMYPGVPEKMPASLPKELLRKVLDQTLFQKDEIDALYDQFTCLANCSLIGDPSGVGYAIDRTAFNLTFHHQRLFHSTESNLLYDRIFSFYDSNGDGLIDFGEFINAIAHMHNRAIDKDRRLRFVFNGFDADADGYISRADVLRIFRAYHTIQKQVVHDLIDVRDDYLDFEHINPVVASGQSLSAIFTDPPPHLDRTRAAQYKAADCYGDVRTNDDVILASSDDCASRHKIINRSCFLNNDTEPHSPASTDDSADPPENTCSGVNLDQIGRPTSAKDAPTALIMQRDRYRRRRFYIDDEEDCSIPDPDTEADNLAANAQIPLGLTRHASFWNTGSSLPSSPMAPAQLEQTNARSTPSALQDPRTFSSPRHNIGREILYQVAQQGLNELLDPIFREKEDLCLEIDQTASARQFWHHRIKEQHEQAILQSAEQRSLLDDASSLQTNHKSPKHKTTILIDQDAHALHSSEDPGGLQETAPTIASEYCLEDHSISSAHIISENPIADVYMGSGVGGRGEHHELNAYNDPTMPQFRPNADLVADQQLGHGNSLSCQEPPRNASETMNPAPKSRKSNTNSNTTSKRSNATARHDSLQPPSRHILNRYSMLNAAEQEMETAGGPGKLSFAEFQAKMSGINGKRLAFVSVWFELCSI